MESIKEFNHNNNNYEIVASNAGDSLSFQVLKNGKPIPITGNLKQVDITDAKTTNFGNLLSTMIDALEQHTKDNLK